MGIRTDLTSLGAIGLGTAIAVVGSGALLFAGVSNSIDADVCIDMPAPPEAPAPDASITVAKLSESGDVSVSVAVSDAPDAPRTITISEQVVVRSGCVDALRSDVHEVRVRALADVDQVRMRADEARILADEIRAEVERARADGRDVSRSSSDEIRELVDAALAEAGVRDRRR